MKVAEKVTIKQYLKDVEGEIESLKKYATDEEKSKLDIDTFDARQVSHCVYGQMTGSCNSQRAKDLMDICCIRVMNVRDEELDEEGVDLLEDVGRKGITKYVNGKYKGQTWTVRYDDDDFMRNYKYLSSLEGYICLADANVEGIINYIKGKTNKLKL